MFLSFNPQHCILGLVSRLSTVCTIVHIQMML